MDNKKGTELLNDTAVKTLSEQEAQIADDAGRVGGARNPTGAPLADLASAAGATQSTNVNSTTIDTGGVMNQTILPGEIGAAGTSSLGGSDDVTGGIANLDNTHDAPVKQNEYNS